MSRCWFLQANPKLYDIDAALASMRHIWWQVRQYTSEVHVGDVVVIWRSGPGAGVVGVGRVVAEPQLRAVRDESERQFVHDLDETPSTQAKIAVRVSPFVPKAEVAALAALAEHPIIRAPMGTVFPIDNDAWTALSALVAAPPPLVEDAAALEFPQAFAWRQRAKGVLPMPGGYDGYLTSLRSVCELIDQERPAQAELPVRMEALLGVAPNAARQRESFLRKMGVIQIEAGVAQLSPWARRWLDSGDDRVVAALLHSRCQLIGELLELCREPLSVDELLAAANFRYSMGWDTNTQVNNRRGWLQSAGMLHALDDRRVQLTEAGAALLDLLECEPPTGGGETAVAAIDVGGIDDRQSEQTGVELTDEASNGPWAAASLLDELADSCTDSSDPDRFERAVTDAFAYLGFRAEWLGKSGRTDVLLDALLGKTETYRVIIDCKTSGSGSVSDQQVDWVTLGEHRKKHDADHVMVVAPNPSGSRLFERARQHDVAVMSVDQLIGICRQHARNPLASTTTAICSATGVRWTPVVSTNERLSSNNSRRSLQRSAR
jgi:predicted RNA-binding protein with PUA-like domain